MAKAPKNSKTAGKATTRAKAAKPAATKATKAATSKAAAAKPAATKSAAAKAKTPKISASKASTPKLSAAAAKPRTRATTTVRAAASAATTMTRKATTVRPTRRGRKTASEIVPTLELPNLAVPAVSGGRVIGVYQQPEAVLEKLYIDISQYMVVLSGGKADVPDDGSLISATSNSPYLALYPTRNVMFPEADQTYSIAAFYLAHGEGFAGRIETQVEGSSVYAYVGQDLSLFAATHHLVQTEPSIYARVRVAVQGSNVEVLEVDMIGAGQPLGRRAT